MSSKLPNHEIVPFEMTLFVRDHCLCLHTQRVARMVARRFDETLRPLGLKSGQFSLLMSLNRPHPPTLGSVADLLAMDRTTLTANLKPLERDGLIEVRPDERDRRARRLVLTEKGRALLFRAVPIWTSTHRDVESALPPGGADRLRADLNTLLHRNEKDRS
ncbi:MarR family winged helix-turn-helix transcriptional regulator [Aquamicrobium ahrensii]|uniref:DNA-binding MarR family transcriptional regulator n=1 Tax=Aquamicrobium ahrensii TaxID=469551 RepID=A0ABV2KP33_9HYPH